MPKLSNADRAVVAIEKLTQYCLNPEHPHGGSKARVFRALLGLTIEHAETLRTALLEAAKMSEAIPKLEDKSGKRYEVVFTMQGPNGNHAEVTSGWIIDKREDFPRLTTCYIRL